MEARTTDWVDAAETGEVVHSSLEKGFWCVNKEQPYGRDRKSTRLNSSH